MPNLVTDRLCVGVEWNVDLADWDAAIAQCPDATYFHTSAWLNTVSRTFRSRVERVRVAFYDGQWALLPLSIRPLAKGMLALACAGETGAFNGLVSPRPLTQAHVDAAFVAIRRRYKMINLVGNPVATSAHLPLDIRAGRAEAEITHMLRLQPLEDLRKDFSRGARSRGNKARKQGLELVVANNPALTSEYYRLYLDSVKRWGEKLTWIRSEAFYQQLMADGGENARLFVAYRGGEAVSALLFVAYGRTAHYVAGATQADHLAACPSNFLMEEALAYYHAVGYEVFDFGASNGLEGVIQFKESFGALPKAYYSLSFRTPVGSAYFALRNAVRLRKAS